MRVDVKFRRKQNNLHKRKRYQKIQKVMRLLTLQLYKKTFAYFYQNDSTTKNLGQR